MPPVLLTTAPSLPIEAARSSVSGALPDLVRCIGWVADMLLLTAILLILVAGIRAIKRAEMGRQVRNGS